MGRHDLGELGLAEEELPFWSVPSSYRDSEAEAINQQSIKASKTTKKNTSTRASWADMRLLPTRRQVAVAPQWRVQWLLTRLHGDTALALSASAHGVPAPAALLVLKTLTEATAPCMLASFAPSRGHGPLGCPGRQRPLCLACLSCCCSWPRAQYSRLSLNGIFKW